MAAHFLNNVSNVFCNSFANLDIGFAVPLSLSNDAFCSYSTNKVQTVPGNASPFPNLNSIPCNQLMNIYNKSKNFIVNERLSRHLPLYRITNRYKNDNDPQFNFNLYKNQFIILSYIIFTISSDRSR